MSDMSFKNRKNELLKVLEKHTAKQIRPLHVHTNKKGTDIRAIK